LLAVTTMPVNYPAYGVKITLIVELSSTIYSLLS